MEEMLDSEGLSRQDGCMTYDFINLIQVALKWVVITNVKNTLSYA